MQQHNGRIPITGPVRQLDSAVSEEPVPRPEVTAETSDALRSLLDDHRLVVAEFEAAEAQAKQALEAEQARLALEAELAQRQIEEAESADEEPEDPLLTELLEQLAAAEQRAADAEQQASRAEQQAALAAQQLAVQVSGALAQPAVAPDTTPASRGSAAALWAGWGLAAIAIAACAGLYFTSYRPLRAQLAAQTQLMEQQADRSSATEAALRERMDHERAEFHDQLSAARASAAAAANAAAESANANAAADSGERAAPIPTKLETRAAKREARLAKKAERAAKLAARAARRKRPGARKDRDDADESPTARHKPRSKPAADDSGSNDPLEGL